MLNENAPSGNGFFVETTFVLFFLSLDFGQNLFLQSFDTAFLGITVLAVAVLPYFLPSAENVGIANWLAGRGAIAFFGIVLGVVFSQVVGSVLPEVFRFVPLTLALAAGLAACYAMFSNVFRLSYAD